MKLLISQGSRMNDTGFQVGDEIEVRKPGRIDSFPFRYRDWFSDETTAEI